MQNPFVYGRVLEPDDICNRLNEIETLKNAMEGGHNTLLMSERRMGKTSIAKAAAQEARTHAAYIDLWPTDDRVTFAKAVGKGVANALQGSMNSVIQTLQDWFQSFRVQSGVDQSGDLYFSFDFQGEPEELSLEHILRIPEKLSERTDGGVAIILDEIQVIDDYPDDFVERKMRSIMQQQNSIAYIFLGSQRHTVQQMFSDRSRPFFQSTKTVNLGTIEVGDWIPYIKTRFEDGDRYITQERIEELCSITEGHPTHTQHLCHELWGLTSPDDSIGSDDLDEALSRVLDQRSYAYTSIMDELSRNQRKLLVALSKEGPVEHLQSGKFARRHDFTSTSTPQKAAQALRNKGYVDQDSDGHYVVDRFLAAWLRKRFAG